MMRDELDRALICIPIVAKDDDEIISQAKKIVEKNKSARIDIAEFRADYYSGLNNYGMLENLLSRIHIILNNAGIRRLFTIRSHEEGGEKLSFTSPTVNEINLYVAKNELSDYIDVEHFSEKDSANRVITVAKEHNIKIILSSHDFEKTPSLNEMVERYKDMKERHADIIKLAVMPQNEQDVDNLLEAVSLTYQTYPDIQIVGISMGELGRRTRIEGYKYGSYLTFAIIDKASAPGQVSVDEL